MRTASVATSQQNGAAERRSEDSTVGTGENGTVDCT